MSVFRRTPTPPRRGLAGPLAAVVAAGLIAAGCSSGGHSAAQSTPTGGTSSKSGSCPTGSATGATSSEVKVAVTIVDITGGSLSNATVGVPSAQEQEADWNLVANKANSSGGAGCRKIVLSMYTVNPIDATAAQQVCLNIAAARPYIVLDSGALTEVGASNCIPAHHIPLASAYLTQDELTKYAPYYLQIGDIPEDSIRNGVLGLNQLGYFSASKGFKKLGVVHHNCTPSLYSAEQAALSQAGIPSSSIDSYSLGCPAGQNDSPAAMEQAVLNFKNAGVTDVTEVDLTDFGLFTQVAGQQDFKPQYLLSDNAVAGAAKQTGPGALDPANANGAVDVVTGGYGEATTPGFQANTGTQQCNAIYAAAGKQSVYTQADGYGGVVCSYVSFVQALLNHASTLQASSLVSAMHATGTVDFSYPEAPINFSAAPAGSAYGVSFWRLTSYQQACKCFQVPDPTFHQPFS